MSLASRLPFRHAYAAGFPGLGSQAVPTDADALDYLDRMAAADGTSVEVGVATAVDAFFRDAKELGVFSSLKACCVLAGARTLAGALVPVVGDAPTNVADGFVEGDYSRTAGLTGDGTSYLDSGRANDDDPQDDVHNSVYVSSAVGTGSVYGLIGTSGQSAPNGETVIGIDDRSSADTVFFRATNNTAALNVAGKGHTTGLYGVARQDAAGFNARVDSTAYSLVQASATPASINAFVFARNNNGTASNISNGTLAFYSIGTSLSLEDLDTAVTNLITAIGEAL
jgi:hypothetical protein